MCLECNQYYSNIRARVLSALASTHVDFFMASLVVDSDAGSQEQEVSLSFMNHNAVRVVYLFCCFAYRLVVPV